MFSSMDHAKFMERWGVAFILFWLVSSSKENLNAYKTAKRCPLIILISRAPRDPHLTAV
jgi:hypothetical protein